MTEVLFTQSYLLRFDRKLHEAMQPYPPLGCLQAAAVVRNQGFEVDVFDAMLADDVSEFRLYLSDAKPRYVVIYEDNFNYLSKMCLTRMRDAALQMIADSVEQGAVVIVCGSDATDHAKRYLDAGARYVIQGEGDATIEELLQWLEGRSEKQVQEISGLIWLRNNEVHTNAKRPVLRDLDKLPWPAWDLIDIGRYRQLWLSHHGRFSMSLVTARGCPFHCNWCAKPIWGQRYNSHSPERVVEFMRHLKETYGAEHIWFMDDIMGLQRGWMRRLAGLLEQSDARLPFKCLSRADLLVRDDEVAAFADAGCEIIWIGAESGSQKILDAMDKGTQLEEIERAAQMLQEHGVKVAFFLQFGYPGEGREQIQQTRDLVRRCQPDDIGISVSYPLPGTRFYDKVETQLGDKQNWVDSADLEMMYHGPFTSDFYRHLHTVIHKEYRSAKIWRQLLKWELPKDHKGLKRIARMMWDRVTLGAAERRLDRLALVAHVGIDPIQGTLSPEQAAQPSPQDTVESRA
ncbi:MAG TPA: radical SAM protein [Myxococcales bacterium]|nr:radical SAM protein [Myxococcales bacterium]HAN32478.1 radical SAM protein [Myxococcales bacterium]